MLKFTKTNKLSICLLLFGKKRSEVISMTGTVIQKLTLSNSATNKSTSSAIHQSNTASNSKSSINDEEMRKFKGLSHAWWIENGGEFEALHRMNK
jgi:hypothetical protein